LYKVKKLMLKWHTLGYICRRRKIAWVHLPDLGEATANVLAAGHVNKAYELAVKT
jgi:hypothetical protein